MQIRATRRHVSFTENLHPESTQNNLQAHMTEMVNAGWGLRFYTTHADPGGVLHSMVWQRDGESEHFEWNRAKPAMSEREKTKAMLNARPGTPRKPVSETRE